MRTWLKANGGAPAVGLLMCLYQWEFVADRLPTISVRRNGREPGWSINCRPPIGPRTSRLRNEINELRSAMHQELRERPEAPYGKAMDGHHQAIKEMAAAATEDEKQEIIHRYTSERAADWFRERQELQQLFGGRVKYVVEELDARGLLRDGESASRIEWLANSWDWLGSAAQELEAAAKRL
jgi:hypothetical protein